MKKRKVIEVSDDDDDQRSTATTTSRLDDEDVTPLTQEEALPDLDKGVKDKGVGKKSSSKSVAAVEDVSI